MGLRRCRRRDQPDASLSLLSRGQGHAECCLLRIEVVHSGSVPTRIRACDRRDAKTGHMVLKGLVLTAAGWGL